MAKATHALSAPLQRAATPHPPCSTSGGRRFSSGQPFRPGSRKHTPACKQLLELQTRLGPEAALIAQEAAHA